ncbi:hypothetical protein Pan97_39260 [Bremerella volcania]|uniref:Uncharacterized protein n=2 Tax=Bremerella volcania TaxID=2527984 RepID=A0A518CCB2_9BACT|nr:hypothetical protein Pan97_39260 [Bremerella volcania]
MILSEKLARLYATYRQRLIDGPKGYFCDSTLRSCSVPGGCNEFPTVEFQREGAPVPFVRQATTDVTEPGAFLVADLLRVSNEPEGATEEERFVTGIRHADQTLYSSNLFLALVAEYVITYDDQTLELAECVLAMLRRLGTWQPGYKEERSNRCRPRVGSTYGYMVRHDAFDGFEESFCEWKKDPLSNDFRSHEPSYDQLGSLNNCGAFAWRILEEADVASDPRCPPDHHPRVDALQAGIIERMTATHRYIATNCRYAMRRCDGAEVDRQGGWCWMYAYPLARTQASARAGGSGNYRPFLEPFLYRFLFDFVENLITVILDGLIDTLPGLITKHVNLQRDIQRELGEFGDFLDLVIRHFGYILEEILRAALNTLREAVRAFVRSDLARWLRDRLAELGNDPLSEALNDNLARALFRVFSRTTLVDPRNELDPDESLHWVLDLGKLLQDLGVVGELPRTIRFQFQWELKTPPVVIKVWNPLCVCGTKVGCHEEVEIAPAQDFGTLDIDWDIPAPWVLIFPNLAEFPVTAPLSLLGELVYSNVDAARFMIYHFFCANAASDTFGENRINPIRAAHRFDNAFFMALMHRFHGVAARGDVKRRLESLETAPEDYPKESAKRGWNQDFRWKRSKRDPGSEGSLYNGVDLMVASMVAASADAPRNRDRLIDAIADARREAEEEEQPGVIRLPFEGPYTDGTWVVWNRTAAHPRTPLLGVEFSRRRPDGGISLRMTHTDNTTTDVDFSQGEPAKSVEVAPSVREITILSINIGTKGEILITV